FQRLLSQLNAYVAQAPFSYPSFHVQINSRQMLNHRAHPEAIHSAFRVVLSLIPPVALPVVRSRHIPLYSPCQNGYLNKWSSSLRDGYIDLLKKCSLNQRHVEQPDLDMFDKRRDLVVSHVISLVIDAHPPITSYSSN